jgi:hypothetical protein
MVKPRGPTKRDRDLLERIRKYETYTDEQAKEIWHEVRRREKRRFPNRFLGKYQHRVAVVRAFIKEYRKEHPGDYPQARNFHKNKLAGLLVGYYGDSPFNALAEAGFTKSRTSVYDPVLAKTPWLALDVIPRSYWESTFVHP